VPLDRFRRDINYLRISLIDACNLRCTYCMPLGPLQFLPPPELLTAQEIRQVVSVAVGIGFRKFRLTGGEPTLRRDLLDVVGAVRGVPGVTSLAMTTNGLLLPELAPELAAAGLTRVNIHVDTLSAERLRQVMRRNELERAWAGIEAAERAGLTPIKLNSVIVRDINDGDVVELARLTVERDWHVRFIELMPLGTGSPARFSRERYVSNVETRARLEAELGPLRPLAEQLPSDESRNFRFDGARGVVGFISPVSEPYCGTCNRLRLTADGKFHLCLLKDDALDVRHALREGGGIAEVERILRTAVGDKPIGHELAAGRTNVRLAMHQVGG
jgi:cyclic pyranopterin phosphate synthase